MTVFTPKSPGEYPESDDEKALAQRGIKLAAKTLVVDLRQLGWQQEKAEGLALIDSKTLSSATISPILASLFLL